MLNLKKTALAVLAFSSSAVFAGTMGPVCTPGSVTVPCERAAWSFGGQALYLQPTGVDQTAGFATATGATFQNFDEDWDWGFKLEAAYQFGTGNDLNVNWYHFDQTTTNGFDLGLGVPSSLSVNTKWDAVNVEMGQHVNFGEQQSVRFHGGLQWAQLERNYTGNAFGVIAGTTQTKFDGIGPRVGADMSYDLGNGFAVYGNGAMALLVGDSDFAVNTATGVVFNSSGSRTTLVPEFEGKIGATYSYPMAQGDLAIDAGYMWVDYLSSQRISFVGSDTDFGFHGPYVGLKWVGNVI